MDEDQEVICFLQKNLPQSDSILVGCRADDDINVHECCEYNIISIDDSYSSKNNLSYCNEFSNGKQNTVFQIRKLSPNELRENQCIQFSNFVYYPGRFLKRMESNHFNQKNQIYHKSFRFRLRKEVFGNVCDLTYLINSLSKDSVDEGLISFKLKMICLKTLRNYINSYLGKEHRPSHLKYQINSVIQKESLKVRERIDSILETIGMHRANISTLVRSEKSLELIMRNDQSHTKKLFLNKLNFFKKNSMNVDGMLLIYNHLVDNFQEIEQAASYKQLLRRTADIDIKSKMTLEKEINLLLKINKQII